MEINAEIKINPDELLSTAREAEAHGRAVLTVDGKPVSSKDFQPGGGGEIRFSEKIQLSPEEGARSTRERHDVRFGELPQAGERHDVRFGELPQAGERHDVRFGELPQGGEHRGVRFGELPQAGLRTGDIPLKSQEIQHGLSHGKTTHATPTYTPTRPAPTAVFHGTHQTKNTDESPISSARGEYLGAQARAPIHHGTPHPKNADDRPISPGALTRDESLRSHIPVPVHEQEHHVRFDTKAPTGAASHIGADFPPLGREEEHVRTGAVKPPRTHVTPAARTETTKTVTEKLEVPQETPAVAGEFEERPTSPSYLSPEYQKSQRGLLTRAADALIGAERAVAETLGSVGHKVKEAGAAVVDTVESGVEKTGDTLASGAKAVKGAGEAVGETIASGASAVVEGTKKAGQKVAEIPHDIKESLPSVPTLDVEGRIAESLKPAPGQMEREFEGLEKAKKAVKHAGKSVAEGTKEAGHKVVDTTKAAGEAIKDTAKSAVDTVAGAGQAVADTTKSAGRAVADTAKSAGHAVVDTTKAAGQKVADVGRSAADTAKAAGRGVADTTRAAGETIADTGRAAKESLPDIEGRIAESLKPAPGMEGREFHERPFGREELLRHQPGHVDTLRSQHGVMPPSSMMDVHQMRPSHEREVEHLRHTPGHMDTLRSQQGVMPPSSLPDVHQMRPSAGRAVADTTKSAGRAVADTAKSAGHAIVDTTKAAGQKVADVGRSAADTAKAVGRGVADTTRAAGETISDTGRAVKESLPGMPDIEGRIAESLKPAPGMEGREFHERPFGREEHLRHPPGHVDTLRSQQGVMPPSSMMDVPQMRPSHEREIEHLRHPPGHMETLRSQEGAMPPSGTRDVHQMRPSHERETGSAISPGVVGHKREIVGDVSFKPLHGEKKEEFMKEQHIPIVHTKEEQLPFQQGREHALQHEYSHLPSPLREQMIAERRKFFENLRHPEEQGEQALPYHPPRHLPFAPEAERLHQIPSHPSVKSQAERFEHHEKTPEFGSVGKTTATGLQQPSTTVPKGEITVTKKVVEETQTVKPVSITEQNIKTQWQSLDRAT